MHRRRLLALAVAAIALACVCARACGGGGDEPAPPASPPAAAGPSPAGPLAPAVPPATPPATPPVAPESPASPGPGGQAGQESPAGEAEGVVTGVETLDPGQVPAAVRAAERFARAWVAPDARWPEPLLEMATPALADALGRSATGPPPREVTGDGYLLFDAPRWARIGVPTGDGTLVLDLSLVADRWLVSAVAWWPASAEVAP